MNTQIQIHKYKYSNKNTQCVTDPYDVYLFTHLGVGPPQCNVMRTPPPSACVHVFVFDIVMTYAMYMAIDCVLARPMYSN